MRYPPLRYYLERVLRDRGGISHWAAKSEISNFTQNFHNTLLSADGKTLSFLSLFFWNSLVFSACEEFLVFTSVLPFFSRDFRGSVGIKNPCFFGGFPCLSPKKKNKERKDREGASGKGPCQKTSKIVQKCQKYFRHFSTFFAQGKKRQKSSITVSGSTPTPWPWSETMV